MSCLIFWICAQLEEVRTIWPQLVHLRLCAPVFKNSQRLQLIDEQHQTKGRELLIRIVSMLIKMIRR